jgi:hypothetical protein
MQIIPSSVAFSGLKIISKLVIAIGVIRDKPPMAI